MFLRLYDCLLLATLQKALIAMQLLNGVLVLLVFQCIGEAINAYFDLGLPGPVLGMLLLFAGLCIVGTAPESVSKASQTLIPLLAIMFMPAAAGIFFLGPEFSDQWPAIGSAIVVGTILSLIFNGLLMKWLASLRRDSNKAAPGVSGGGRES